MRPTESVEDCLKLRSATAADRGRVEALLLAESLTVDGIPEDMAGYTVAEVEGEGVIAVAGLEQYGDAALLRSTAVAPNWRGAGVGRVLVEEVLNRAQREGAREIYLLTFSAEAWFPRFGFRCINREEVPAEVTASVQFQGACPDTATVMKRPCT
ncbi:MAG: arsenic resistance N-acetyltransferase ArsN2 [Gemmatimonadota bacterium]